MPAPTAPSQTAQRLHRDARPQRLDPPPGEPHHRRTAWRHSAAVAHGVGRLPAAAAITNPCLLVEVLSPATAAFDRGEKFQHVQRIPSVEHDLLLSQDQPQAELFTRTGPAWRYPSFDPGDTIPFTHLNIELSVDALYAELLG